ncbi:unnamed protein product [Trifolium pratense]|uniref:Uncharacterized protein n=1 Tax=Trifolium pratense TaxID=57577 RepID=A0ACB0IVQ9_TRIPR|nr:unnamed protein product [Trifolium pratense]
MHLVAMIGELEPGKHTEELDGWHVLNHTLVAIAVGWEEQCEGNNNQ